MRKKKLLSVLVWQLNSPSEYTNIVFLPTPLQYVYVNCLFTKCQPFTLLSDNHNNISNNNYREKNGIFGILFEVLLSIFTIP